MKLRYKIGGVFLAVAAVTVVGVLVALRYEAPCKAPPTLLNAAAKMQAILHRCYGPPEVLVLAAVAKPTPADNEVLVKLRAASVNPADWHNLRGEPYFIRAVSTGWGRPRREGLGTDFAGTVEAVGKDVTRFRPGDEVFGGRGPSLAEYIRVPADRVIILKPTNLTFEQAAAVPVAGITALQALRDEGQIRPGQKVLINGASGGVGTFAVQIAKAFGAEVTGVCSTRNLAMVRGIGADHVIDYTREDFTQSDERYDLIVDMVGSHSPLEYRRVLKPDGALVVVGSASRGRWLGAVVGMIKAVVYAPFVREDFSAFFATLKQPDLAVLTELLREGKVKPVIDRTYRFRETADAIRYLEEGHARGKIVVTFE